MNLEQAKTFAEQSFSNLDNLNKRWNLLHSKFLVRAIKELTPNKNIRKKIIPLAWVHDIGKIKSEENHAKLSLELLKDFKLDEIEKDCILNHGSSAKPRSEEGKIFRNGDGLSLFYPETIKFRLDVGIKEGKTPTEIKSEIEKFYHKYLGAYSDNPLAIKLLNKKYTNFHSNN
ncbi:hypothetical protein FJZ17_04295 [Candidatus Pacearchaeota archaeon]|nr:hypothetical protein [Candidatus Pacearchaeota archaeon]